VELLVGSDKGKQGIITQVIQERNWVIVEGLNCELKVYGKSRDFPGIYIKSEQPLLVTNEVALVDPSDL
jgi:large subunit ribosomal protein L24